MQLQIHFELITEVRREYRIQSKKKKDMANNASVAFKKILLRHSISHQTNGDSNKKNIAENIKLRPIPSYLNNIINKGRPKIGIMPNSPIT